jgi:hypothetical protein
VLSELPVVVDDRLVALHLHLSTKVDYYDTTGLPIRGKLRWVSVDDRNGLRWEAKG